mgnify:CR=1 FL=1
MPRKSIQHPVTSNVLVGIHLVAVEVDALSISRVVQIQLDTRAKERHTKLYHHWRRVSIIRSSVHLPMCVRACVRACAYHVEHQGKAIPLFNHHGKPNEAHSVSQPGAVRQCECGRQRVLMCHSHSRQKANDPKNSRKLKLFAGLICNRYRRNKKITTPTTTNANTTGGLITTQSGQRVRERERESQDQQLLIIIVQT